MTAIQPLLARLDKQNCHEPGEVRKIIDEAAAALREQQARIEALEKDATRYAMLFRGTWYNGQGIAIFRYRRLHEGFERVSLEDSNKYLDGIIARQALRGGNDEAA